MIKRGLYPAARDVVHFVEAPRVGNGGAAVCGRKVRAVRRRSASRSVSIQSMRKLLMLGLSLALALQGVAQAGLVETLCPIQKPGQIQAMPAGDTAPCCNSADTAAKTGKACKTGQACPATGAWLMSQLAPSSFPAATVSLVSSREPFAFRIDPGGHWRPPALS